MAMFFLAGLCFASWASRIASIQQELRLSDAGLGAVLFAIPVGLMCSLPFSGWVITRIGSRKLLLGAIIVYGLALIGLGASQNTLQLVICLLCFGFASNAVNISVNTQAVSTERLYEKPIMASFHGVWSMAGFIGAGIGTFMIGFHIIPFVHFILIFIIIVIGALLLSQRLHQDRGAVQTEATAILTIRERIRLMFPLLKLGIIAFCSMICEGAMFDWSVIYFKKVIHAQGAWMGAGYTSFMCFMAIGRFTADWFAGRYGLKRTLQWSGTLTATGLMISVIFPYLLPSMFAFMMVGVGVSSVVPMIYSAAGKSKGISPGVALSAVSTIGFSGFLIGPPIIGFIAGLFTLRASFVLIALMGMSVVVVSSRTELDS
jgi:MFS family permease